MNPRTSRKKLTLSWLGPVILLATLAACTSEATETNDPLSVLNLINVGMTRGEVTDKLFASNLVRQTADAEFECDTFGRFTGSSNAKFIHAFFQNGILQKAIDGQDTVCQDTGINKTDLVSRMDEIDLGMTQQEVLDTLGQQSRVALWPHPAIVCDTFIYTPANDAQFIHVRYSNGTVIDVSDGHGGFCAVI